ncbi:hypothetical protein ACQPYK_25330 [Streptosporangium sp. CA-135522]|uniref:hypothetical protein n=1 Tax=Streptosporangium sp. CA-135522 TaxID=3240072 RepID=UPI003D8AB8FC
MPGLACIPQAVQLGSGISTEVSGQAAQLAGFGTPTGIALGALGILAVSAVGVAIWVVKRNARHVPSRKQKRKQKPASRDTGGDETLIA